MNDPARAERLRLAIALATWWLLSVGGEAEADLPEATLLPLPGAARQSRRGWRLMGIFRRGWYLILAALLNHQPLPFAYGRPEAWPTLPLTEPSPPRLELAESV